MQADSIQHAENIMADKAFNTYDAVTFSGQPSLTTLVPATSSKITIEQNGLHLQANSSGKTLLILPFEFSHCLTIKSLSGSVPIVIRVDIALMGILFEKQVNVSIDNRTGLFANPRCKLTDYREFAQLWKKGTLNGAKNLTINLRRYPSI